MLLTVEKIIKETDDAVSVVFKKPGFFSNVKYKPGQFLTLKVPVENKIENRSYSLSSSPWLHKFLRITVKKVKDGLVSNYICNELKEGQKIEIDKPMGNFFIIPNKKETHQYVLMAGGSGITPIYSIILSVLEKEPKSSILLVYANQSKQTIIFKNELEALLQKYPNRISVKHFLERIDSPEKDYYEGRLNEDLLTTILKEKNITYSKGKFMLCGPQGFMDASVEILKKNGVPENKIMLEAFTADLSKMEAESVDSSAVTISGVGFQSSITVKKGETILKAALDSNVEIPYSCRSGMCSSCKAKCTSGSVKMLDGHLLPENEIADGYVLTCISFPTSENVALTLPQ
ncbi:ferredoxin--NADP reductase [Aquimarina agarilytica]|uniref:ferredoxin--NADP reductase n=1 Tax=Aquimarina agarilytica TaxID=1087449 RepID=UPI000289B98A|nr:ferredoxin--NADP reductase [Aquimarina agarilytica]